MQIITDSAADLTPEDIQTWGIRVVPLFIEFPNEELSASDISADQFYDRLRRMIPQIPTSSQPSLGHFLDAYDRAIAEGQDVLSIHLSSGLSGVVNTAKAAAKQVNEKIGRTAITVIDTLALSAPERLQVLVAAMALKAGWSLDRVIAHLKLVHQQYEGGYTLETLDYLARGGRIGRVAALTGSILKIKPVITVEKTDGKYSTAGKARTIQQTMTIILEMMLAVHGSQKPVWATVLHGQFAEKAEQLAEMIRARMNVVRLDTIRISPVLGVHTGPQVVGACVLPMELIEGISSMR